VYRKVYEHVIEGMFEVQNEDDLMSSSLITRIWIVLNPLKVCWSWSNWEQ